MRPVFLLILLSFVNFCFGQRLIRASLNFPIPSLTNCTPVKDQYLSSTCWSFSSMSFLESELMKIGKGVNDLSEMFIARHSMMRKIERHLKLKGGNFFTPGASSMMRYG